MNSPIDLYLLFCMNNITTPTVRRGRANAAMSTLNPRAEIIQAVTVVPMLAPMITPMDWARVRSPALTKLTTITVVADDDWMSAVMSTPVKTPVTLLVVMAVRMRRILSPASF